MASTTSVMALGTTVAPAYIKQEYIGAVTLLHFSRDGSLLYVGVGGTLFAYETTTGKLVTSWNVFPRGILHRLDYVARENGQNFVVFFGQKQLQCVRNLPENSANALTQRDGLLRVGKTKVCSDWIFDARILSHETRDHDAFPTVVIGLAHNFIQFWDPNGDQLLRTVVCSERCILYSLSFHGRTSEELLVASGTVFQQVLVWAPGTEGDRADPTQRLHGHDGVIFQLEWSSDANMLASVSDDRTVQLWTSPALGDQLTGTWSSRFRAWGHTARLWDVRFCDAGIVTTSEDGMAKVWDLDGACVATLQGHSGKHVWRVAVHPSSRLLATGGGDGAVKLWDMQQQIASTISSAGANAELVRLSPADSDAPPANMTKKKSSSVSVRDIVILRSTSDSKPSRGFVAVEDGRIFELALHDTTSSSLVFCVTDKTSTIATPNVSSFALDEDQRFFLIGDASGVVLVVEVDTLQVRACWRAHASRIMKVWWHESAYSTLLTCGADGAVREWLLQETAEPVLVGSFIGPAKCATSALAIVDGSGTRNILCGDARANLFGFARSLGSTDSQARLPAHEHRDIVVEKRPSFVLRGVHGRDMISTLVCGGQQLVYSGGHDGYICSFLIESNSQNNDQLPGQITLRCVGRESIKGITTIKQLWWTTPTQPTPAQQQQQLMVFGFHATFAVLFNFTAQYRLFNIECGGWRRPHALLLLPPQSHRSSAIPSHTFLFTPVTKSAELLVQVHSTAGALAVVVARASLHHQFHGRTTTCTRAIGRGRLVTAGEDNCLKLHQRLPVDSVDASAGVDRWTCLSTGVAHTTTIRALASFYAGSWDAHVLLSGGGKQRLNAWCVHDGCDVLEFLCGHEMSDADQDHRILGLTTFSLAATDRYRIVVACNSEGAIQILILDLDKSTLVELGQCSSSKKPILSCDSVQRGDRALLAVGSTDGMVNVWDLSAFLQQLSIHVSSSVSSSVSSLASAASDIQQLQPVYKYLAHDMGTNCLCIAQSTSPSTFRIISGGDDQNLHVRELTIDTLELVQQARARNASGSALKTVGTSRDGRFVYCAGYDQRVSQWKCMSGGNAGGDDERLGLEWQSAAFTECADIADLDVWDDATANHDTVVVVGQGLQTVQFNTVMLK